MPLRGIPEEITKQGYKTIGQVRKLLKEKGYFCNRRSIWKYEAEGILPKPKRIKVNAWEWRVYTDEDIKNIFLALKSQPVRHRIYVTKVKKS